MTKNRRQVDVVDPASERRDTRTDYAQCWKGWGSPDKVWVGFFIDWETGLEWVKAQTDPETYTLNNVPPSAAMGGNGTKPVRPVRKQTGLRPAPTVEPSRGVLPAVPVTPKATPKAPESAEVKALRKDAEVLLDKHRADEAAEIAEQGGVR